MISSLSSSTLEFWFLNLVRVIVIQVCFLRAGIGRNPWEIKASDQLFLVPSVRLPVRFCCLFVLFCFCCLVLWPMEFSFNHIWVKMILLFCGYWILQWLPTRNEVVFHYKAGASQVCLEKFSVPAKVSLFLSFLMMYSWTVFVCIFLNFLLGTGV